MATNQMCGTITTISRNTQMQVKPTQRNVVGKKILCSMYQLHYVSAYN